MKRNIRNMNWSLLLGPEVFKGVPIVAYKRDCSLWDLLVHGKTDKALNRREAASDYDHTCDDNV